MSEQEVKELPKEQKEEEVVAETRPLSASAK